MNTTSPERLARQVAHAAGSFEHVLLGRSPTSVSIVADDEWMVLHIHESFSQAERRLALEAEGARRVREFHRYLFEHSLDSLVRQVRRTTGIELRGAIAHVDVETGSVLKTLTTRTDVDLFLLGQGLPALGVPVNAHLHANGTSVAGGNGATHGRTPGGNRNHEEGDPCWC
jgi:uncharacterized protein YbcI